jgi:hypothetical protein
MNAFQRMYPPSVPTPGAAYWFLFRGHDLLVQAQGDGLKLPLMDETAAETLNPGSALYLGTLGGVACLAGEVSAEQAVPEGWRAVGKRDTRTPSY